MLAENRLTDKQTKKFAMKAEQLQQAYFIAASIMLALTALAKGFALIWPSPDFSMQMMRFDPIFFFLSNQTMLWFAVFLELAVCGLIFGRSEPHKKYQTLCWIGCLFVAYRIGLSAGNFSQPCLCLGGSLERLGLSSDATRNMATLILLFILLPSGMILIDRKYAKMLKQRSKAHGKSKNKSGTTLLVAGLLCFGTDVKSQVEEKTFQLEGELEFSTFGFSDYSPSKDSFTITIQKEGRWQMTYHTPGLKDGYIVSGSDGKDTYEIAYSLKFRSKDPRHREQRRRGEISELPVTREFKSVDDKKHYAKITPGLYPYDFFFRGSRVIWFALASSHYLNTSTNPTRMPVPWSIDLRSDTMAYLYENQINVFPEWPHLPSKAGFFNLGKEGLSEENLAEGVPSFLEIDYDEGHPNANGMAEQRLEDLKNLEPGTFSAEYNCGLSTNVNGAIFPLHFELRSYFDKDKIQGHIFAGQITNIVEIKNAAPMGKPPIRGRGLTTEDYRFRNRAEGGTINYLRYSTSTNVWLEMDDDFLKVRQAERKMNDDLAGKRRFGRIVGMALMLAIIAMPLISWWKKRRQNIEFSHSREKTDAAR